MNNRPYSPQMVEQAHPSMGKTQVNKVLKYLASQGSITMKENGKSVIYWKNQKDTTPDNSQDSINVDDEDAGGGDDNSGSIKHPPPLTVEELSSQIEILKTQVEQQKQILKDLESKSSKLQSELTNSEIDSQCESISKENQDLYQKLSQFKSKGSACTPNEKLNLELTQQKYRREWIKRKKIFKDALDAILERANKKRKDLKEKIGWEDDEDFKVTMIPERKSTTSQPPLKRIKR
eukprot:gene2159-2658_t